MGTASRQHLGVSSVYVSLAFRGQHVQVSKISYFKPSFLYCPKIFLALIHGRLQVHLRPYDNRASLISWCARDWDNLHHYNFRDVHLHGETNQHHRMPELIVVYKMESVLKDIHICYQKNEFSPVVDNPSASPFSTKPTLTLTFQSIQFGTFILWWNIKLLLRSRLMSRFSAQRLPFFSFIQ